ncbi:type II secretion system protein [Aciduricibacillus chroicocephali]|uniref:Type II secretion system protein n=1 Tax=Aciduricibacillus chroicocephali TaxID=3054939 RepID=A0ABY9KTH2_9BACI|nr:type II secretion system protein [Bacillaceae bacterium 44XB]
MFKKYMQKLKKDQRGLTLVELLAVVVILAIVAAIAFVVIGNVIDNSKKDAQVANAQQMITAAKLYESSGGEIGSGSGGVTAATLQSEGSLSKLTDPWKKGPYGTAGTVTASGTKDSRVYVVKLNDTDSKCTINSTEENLNKEGRKACGKNLSTNTTEPAEPTETTTP